jgi:hypothetical protein
MREKGLCFSCNERYTPGYRCAVLRLFTIEAEAKDSNSLRDARDVGTHADEFPLESQEQ